MNVASATLGAKVIVGHSEDELLNNNTTIYDDENGKHLKERFLHEQNSCNKLFLQDLLITKRQRK